MNQKLLVIGLLFVFITISISGCTNQNTETNSEPTDSDGDGYPDSQDDFPYDGELHKKVIINNDDRRWKLSPGEWEDVNFYISYYDLPDNPKYVIVDMESDYEITFFITCPTGYLMDTVTSKVDTQYYLTEENKGDCPDCEWRFVGRNDGQTSTYVDIKIEVWG